MENKDKVPSKANAIYLLSQKINEPYLAAIVIIGLAVTSVLSLNSENNGLPIAIITAVLCVVVVILKIIDYRKPKVSPTTPPDGTIYVPTKHSSSPIPIYTFYDLKNEPGFTHNYDGKTVTYQDFDNTKRQGKFLNNINFIQNMWASSNGDCYIKANTVNTAEEGKALRVEFNSTGGVSNVTIRPHFGIPLKLPAEVNHLVIRARVNTAKTNEINGNDKLHVGVRLINGYFQHWSHGNEALKNTPFPIDAEGFRDIEIPLSGVYWRFFHSDGNIFYETNTEPATASFDENTFKYIMGVNLAFGTERGDSIAESLDAGKGVVEISKIYFK
jgi:hypothetical protein